MSAKPETAPPSEGDGRPNDSRLDEEDLGPPIFEVMTRKYIMLFFLFVLPALWGVLVGVGWSKDDKIEEEVYNIWTRQRSDFANDKEYSEAIGRADAPASTFAAMAISRDGENLFTPERLEEIRTRMEEAEATTIEYKGETYTWDDVCYVNNAGPGTTYQFPCFRLSPMDYFREANWFFEEEDRVTWYQDIARKSIIAPRVPRFGIMQQICSNLTIPTGRTECDEIIIERTLQNAPLLLFVDIGSMENNHPCKMCIEEEFESTMDNVHGGALQMFNGLYQFANATGQTDLATMYATILTGLDRQAAIDFYSYYVTRGLYIELGKEAYMESRDGVNGLLTQYTGQQFPPTTEAEAVSALANHADHAFSSSVTAGNPLPLWGNDGEGYLLEGFLQGQPLSPVGGSGIDMSGDIFSTIQFFEAPSAEAYASFVLTDPVHAWFVAGVTPMTAKCGNDFLKGTNGFGPEIDGVTNELMKEFTSQWCTKHNTPFGEEGEATVQHFARMWFDLLQDSDSFLGLTQGTTDPYVWTTGLGCGYSFRGLRYSYREATSQEELMENASGELYYIDEGEALGAIDKNLLLGGRVPADYSPENPLQKVSVIQSIYASLIAEDIVKRVKNCNRPGGPIEIDVKEAEEILEQFKEAIENSWTKSWDDDDAGEVSFVAFFDDVSVIGTTGRMLRDITLSNSELVVISIVIIAVFSILFVLSSDPVESRIAITTLGVGLVILAFFAAVGFGIILGIKINVTIAWTLPFVMLGLGVDDMYIVLLSLKEQPGYTLADFRRAMKEVFVPITMTSIVNASMFAIMNLNDIPAIYLTAQVALISVAFLYMTVAFCFSTWCYVDMLRQADGRKDILCCGQDSSGETRRKHHTWTDNFYKYLYRPILFKAPGMVLMLSHLIIWVIACVLVGFGIWGLMEDNRDVGLGLEDFFPNDNPASKWASVRTEQLASWAITMNWGEVDYTIPDIQLKVIEQFENVVASPYIAEVETKNLWLADFLIWTTYQCTENFAREDASVLVCGRDEIFPGDESSCSGSWVPNSLGLREKIFGDDETCVPREGGICRPTSQMHPLDLETFDGNANDVDSWCPIVEGWSNEKLSFCLTRWRDTTGGGGNMLLLNETGTPRECAGEFRTDEIVEVPIRFAVGPSMFAIDLTTHQITIDMIEETRAFCDDNEDIHCWMSGIPYNYWSQYIGIFETFWEIASTAIGAGFGVSFLFLAIKLMYEKKHSPGKVFGGALVGSLLITVTTIMSLVCVSGLSSLFGVSFTGFSTMSFVLSVGFAVEYSVHVVARWLMAPNSLDNSLDRVEYAMEFLFLPTFMSFVSSTIGVVCLAFTEFAFNEVFFFRPLLVVMLVTYFLGCWWLPAFLSLIDVDFVRFGSEEPLNDKGSDHQDKSDDEEVDSSDQQDLPAVANQK